MDTEKLLLCLTKAELTNAWLLSKLELPEDKNRYYTDNCQQIFSIFGYDQPTEEMMEWYNHALERYVTNYDSNFHAIVDFNAKRFLAGLIQKFDLQHSFKA